MAEAPERRGAGEGATHEYLRLVRLGNLRSSRQLPAVWSFK